MHQRARIFASWMLLVFVIGGLGAPLAHDVAHAFVLQGQQHAPASSSDAVASNTPTDAFECELCEVVFTATTDILAGESSILLVDEHASALSPIPHSNSAIAPQSRAPPLLVA